MSLFKRIVSNGIASTLDKLAKMAEHLLLVPFFIYFWGVDVYGEWLTLMILPTVFALSHLGFGNAVGNTFILEYLGGAKNKAANTLATGISIINYGVILISVISLLILFGLKEFGIFNKMLINPSEAAISIYLMFCIPLVTFYLAVYEQFYKLAKKAHIGIFISACTTILKIIVAVVLLNHGSGPLGIASGFLIITIIMNIIYIYISKKIFKDKDLKEGKFDRNILGFLFFKGIGYFLNPLWRALYFQGTTLLIRVMLGPSAVVIYNTMRVLMNTSAQVFNIVSSSIYPDFQVAVGEKNPKKVNNLFSFIFISNIIVAIAFMIFISIFGKDIYVWWTKGKILVPNDIWIYFISSVIFYAMWFSQSLIFESHNKPYSLTLTGILVSIISVSTTWFSIKILGINGIGVGVLIFDLTMFLVLSKISSNLVKSSFFQIFRIFGFKGVRK
ncbi:lipopolysaccharide biosynthesis protein [Acinetobacter sp. YH16039]|uniref:lipopolysaccharide biosynthesis protein n=1 Tax=Acinetobacter sp. YH16039 TaxID=2601184 RepID=UPI0015D43B6A|nr:hypothetical protein [Acinetobacter sp. YH16039]